MEKKLIKDIENITYEIEMLNAMFKTKIENKVNDATKLLGDANKELVLNSKLVEELEGKVEKLDNIIDLGEKTINDNNYKINTLNELLTKLLTDSNDINKNFTNINSEIEKNSEASNIISNFLEKQSEILNNLNKMSSSINEFQSKLIKLNGEIDYKEKELNELEKKCNSITSSNSYKILNSSTDTLMYNLKREVTNHVKQNCAVSIPGFLANKKALIVDK